MEDTEVKYDKVLVMPDAHLKVELLYMVNDLLEAHPTWQCVSLGDWADDWAREPNDYGLFYGILWPLVLKFKNRFFLCWGNHDYGYWADPGRHSGYMPDSAQIVRHYLRMMEEAPGIYMVIQIGNTLFSHAGLTKYFYQEYERQTKNSSLEGFLQWTNRNYRPRYMSVGTSPLWHRPSANWHKDTFDNRLLQVVGHTPVPTATYRSEPNILYTDTWSTDSERNPLGDKSLVVVDPITQEWEKIPYDDKQEAAKAD